jgi:predicted nuclease of predicted toxin-antitoxin system
VTHGIRLLVDENLSARLVALLEDLFPDSRHVDQVGLRGQNDLAIWRCAEQERFTIVSKDSDFVDLSVVRGTPPRVILLGIGNAPTRAVEALLRASFERIVAFHDDPGGALLELSI